MVRILSNGEIVQDDDPRAASPPSGRSPQQGNARERRGNVQNIAEQDVHYHMPQTTSLFEPLNQRLTQAGVPRWHLGPYTVEPVVSLGFLAALLLLGFKGLLLGLFLFFVHKWSQSGTPQSQRSQGWQAGLRRFGFGSDQADRTGSTSMNSERSRGSSSGHTWDGTGHRLGRS